MPQDIDQVLAIEIKKEMADRYFGFRKLIEETSRIMTIRSWPHPCASNKKSVLTWSGYIYC